MIFKTIIPSTKKIFIIILILNIIAIFTYTSMFLGLKKKNEESSVLLSELSEQNSVESKLRLIGNNLDETELERRKLDSFFVQDGEIGVAEFMDDMEAAGDLAKVSMDVSSILLRDQGAGEESDLVEEMKLNLKVSGDWYDVVYFLKLVELMPYKISFDRVYLEKESSSKEGEEINWKGSFNLSVLKLDNK